jgi:hypothetical protein
LNIGKVFLGEGCEDDRNKFGQHVARECFVTEFSHFLDEILVVMPFYISRSRASNIQNKIINFQTFFLACGLHKQGFKTPKIILFVSLNSSI